MIRLGVALDWARAPMLIARGVYALELVFLAGLGLAIWWASSPVLDLTVPDGWQAAWGVTLSLAALGTLAGLVVKGETVERWATLLLASLLIGYAAAPFQLVLAGDRDRLVYSIIAAALAIIPTARAWALLRRPTKSGHVRGGERE